MSKKLIFLFSHRPTDEQIRKAREELSVEEFIIIPDEIKKVWSNIPPKIESLKEYLLPIFNWLSNNLRRGDYILVQGDYGATYLTVQFCFKEGYIPVYATTERVAVEKLNEDGTLSKTNIFKHKKFRLYERI